MYVHKLDLLLYLTDALIHRIMDRFQSELIRDCQSHSFILT